MKTPDEKSAQRAVGSNVGLADLYITEAMIDAPRGFLMGLELGCKNLESMRAHLDRCGYEYGCWPEWAKNDTGHITKAGKAVLIYTMMDAANHDIGGAEYRTFEQPLRLNGYQRKPIPAPPNNLPSVAAFRLMPP